MSSEEDAEEVKGEGKKAEIVISIYTATFLAWYTDFIMLDSHLSEMV